MKLNHLQFNTETNNAVKLTVVLIVAAALVFLVVYLLDSTVSTASENSIYSNLPERGNLLSIFTEPTYHAFDATDYDEMDRIEMLTGLNNTIIVLYIFIFFLNVCFAFFSGNFESISKIFLFSLYTSFAVTFILDFILKFSYPYWTLGMSLSLYFKGIFTGLFASFLVSFPFILRNFLNGFKDKVIDFHVLKFSGLKISALNVPLLLHKSWILFTLLLARIIFINILINIL